MKKVFVWFNNGYEEETGYRYAIEPKEVKKGYTFIGLLSENYEFIREKNAPLKMVNYFINMLGISYNETVIENGAMESVFNPTKIFNETIKRISVE